MTFEEKRCQCGAAIIWASTKANKAMPVDAALTDDGNVLVTERPGREPLAVVLEVTALDAHRGLLRHSHFTTCPLAERFRKKPAPARRRTSREGSS